MYGHKPTSDSPRSTRFVSGVVPALAGLTATRVCRNLSRGVGCLTRAHPPKREHTPGAPDRGDGPPLPCPWEASQWARVQSHVCPCLHKRPRQSQGGVAGLESVLSPSGYGICFCESRFLVGKAVDDVRVPARWATSRGRVWSHRPGFQKDHCWPNRNRLDEEPRKEPCRRKE